MASSSSTDTPVVARATTGGVVDGAEAPASRPAWPEPEEPLLVLKQEWTDLVISGRKTLEIRGYSCSPGRWLFGTSKAVFGMLEFGEAFKVTSEKHWQALTPQHCVQEPGRPYGSRCTANPIIDVQVYPAPIPYQWQRGCVGHARFRPVPGGGRAAGSALEPQGGRTGSLPEPQDAPMPLHPAPPALPNSQQQPRQSIPPVGSEAASSGASLPTLQDTRLVLER